MNSADDKFALAVQLFQANRLDEAESICRPLAARFPKAAQIFTLLGFIAHGKKDRDGVVRYLKRALTLGETNVDCVVALADTYQAQQNPKEAWVILQKALTGNATNPKVLALLASISLDFGRISDAIGFYEQWQGRTTGDPLSFTKFGIALLRLGRLEDALSAFDRALRLDPNHPTALAFSIRALAAKGDLAAAELRAQQAAALQPTSTDIRDAQRETKLLRSLITTVPAAERPVEPKLHAEYARRASDSIAGLPEADLNVVFFHVAQARGHVIERYQENETADYMRLLSRAATAAKKTAPRVNTVLLTDSDTHVREGSSLDAAIRLPVRREWIMYERMRAQRAFVAGGGLTANTLFIDTDLFLNRSFDPVFAQDFDVGLTWRTEWPYMPINGGMIMARKGRTVPVLKFFDTCLAAYEAMVPLESVKECFDFDIREFQGDQLALAAFSHWRAPPTAPEVTNIHDVTVRYFPCETFNVTYQPTLDAAIVEQAYALHFKGTAKKFAEQVASRKRG